MSWLITRKRASRKENDENGADWITGRRMLQFH